MRSIIPAREALASTDDRPHDPAPAAAAMARRQAARRKGPGATVPRRGHATLGGQRERPADVDRAPDAARAARREADGVAALIHAPADAIDPAEAQGLIHRLGPGDARRACAALVEAHQQFCGAAVMSPQPGTKRRTAGDRKSTRL